MRANVVDPQQLKFAPQATTPGGAERASAHAHTESQWPCSTELARFCPARSGPHMALSCRQMCVHGDMLLTTATPPGSATQITVTSVSSDSGGQLESDERTGAAHGAPLCLASDVVSVVLGFPDGAVAVFGKHGFTRWHAAAVLCAAVCPEHDCVLSASMDGTVNVWTRVRPCLAGAVSAC